ncbi:MAG: Mov34/MPN/PAD-1 family protein [Candidatus Hodarchaeales archaeon]
MDLIQFTSDNRPVYPVYILKRVVDQLVEYCKEETPIEALGILIGWHYQLPEPHSKIRFTKVTDWVTGEVDASHIGAQFTEKGISEYNMLLDEKYGKDRDGPNNVGLFHSHPFGFEPHFSTTDYSTFLVFPYNSEHNVFILIDPIPEDPFLKVFQLKRKNNKLELIQVPWIEYSPVSKDFEGYHPILDKHIGQDRPDSEIRSAEVQSSLEEIDLKEEEDPIFNPAKVEEISNKDEKEKENKKKSTLSDYF